MQRGLAQKVQEMSGQFRKKQKVYMSSTSLSLAWDEYYCEIEVDLASILFLRIARTSN